jgi:hypothetical protein
MIARDYNLNLTVPSELLQFAQERAAELGYGDVADYINSLIQAEAEQVQRSGAAARDTRPIWEAVKELGASVADSEWAKVPADLGMNLKHYLYGERREEE